MIEKVRFLDHHAARSASRRQSPLPRLRRQPTFAWVAPACHRFACSDHRPGVERAGSRHEKFLARRYGGTGTTESAVGRGLEWLAKQQRTSGPLAGLWSLTGPYSNAAVLEKDNPTRPRRWLCSPFRGRASRPAKENTAQAVDKAWTALLKHSSATVRSAATRPLDRHSTPMPNVRSPSAKSMA